MAPKRTQAQCQICTEEPSKYTCPQCSLLYCSVACYKAHKGSFKRPISTPERSSNAFALGTERQCAPSISQNQPKPQEAPDPDEIVVDEDANTNPPEAPSVSDEPAPTPLRALSSLNWPYVPEESAFPDPLKRDDPKTLQLPHYEAIATSPTIRKVLEKHPHLPDLLTKLDLLRGREREEALQEALGVTAPHIDNQLRPPELGEDVLALRELAEAVEGAVRGGKEGTLGLDWDPEG